MTPRFPTVLAKTLPDLLVIAVDGRENGPACAMRYCESNLKLRIIVVGRPIRTTTSCYWASLDVHSDDIEPTRQDS